ncbi:MAG: metallophosphoesterase [Sedimentisphaerales bacterium]|nr:metallophosphoesterase [Sedimentisphaerales bacterium]
MVFYLLIILPATCPAQEPWKFIVTCDSRGSDNGIEAIILGELVNEILDQGVDFMLFPGDLVSGYAYIGPAGFEAELRTWVDMMLPVYKADIGVYVSRGNHEVMDVWGYSIRPNIDPDDNHATRWLNVFGNDLYPEQKLPDNGPESEKYMTYAVTHKNAFIISLDQYAGINHDDVHVVNQKWLDTQLAANTKPHIFITGHEPAFRALHSDCLDNRPAERDAFWASIRNAGGRTYLTGHDHFYDHARIDDGDGNPDNDVHQYIIATAGAPLYTWSPSYDGDNGPYTVEQINHVENYGYVLVEVDGLNVTLIWMERHTIDLTIPGIYQPADFWSYSVTGGPIILSPNGGENLVAASSYNITWKTQEPAELDTVTIEYSSDNGQNWNAINTVINTGSYTWDPLPVADSNQCLIRISDPANAAVSDTSDETFTIFHCQKQLTGDLNGDCYVNILDIAILMNNWLECGNPFDALCD